MVEIMLGLNNDSLNNNQNHKELSELRYTDIKVQEFKAAERQLKMQRLSVASFKDPDCASPTIFLNSGDQLYTNNVKSPWPQEWGLGLQG